MLQSSLCRCPLNQTSSCIHYIGWKSFTPAQHTRSNVSNLMEVIALGCSARSYYSENSGVVSQLLKGRKGNYERGVEERDDDGGGKMVW